MTAPVLVVACLDDPTTDLVLDELHGRGIPVVRFDPGADFPDEIALSAHFDGSGMTGSIDTPDPPPGPVRRARRLLASAHSLPALARFGHQ